MNKVLAFLMPLILFASCLQDEPIKKEFRNFQPVELNDGWEIAEPEAVGIDSELLKEMFIDFHNDEDLWMVRSLSVFRKNKIIAESFTRDESDRTTPRAFWSCTKQIVGVLVGIALEEGLIESVNDSIGKYLPDVIKKYPDKGKIKIIDLLTMRSGLDFTNYGWDGDDSQVLQEIPSSFLEYSLAKAFRRQPGEKFEYKDSDPTILSAVIQKQAGLPTDEWANNVLFKRIGFKNYHWRRYKDGITIGSYGILSTPREMAKIAQLVLNKGVWANDAIVSAQWLTAMTSSAVETTDEKRFGYLWWSYPEYKTYFMAGNGRQLIFVFPDKELIVVITSEPKLQGSYQLSTPNGRNIAQKIYDICN